jgi:hypothetical protein
LESIVGRHDDTRELTLGARQHPADDDHEWTKGDLNGAET